MVCLEPKNDDHAIICSCCPGEEEFGRMRIEYEQLIADKENWRTSNSCPSNLNLSRGTV